MNQFIRDFSDTAMSNRENPVNEETLNVSCETEMKVGSDDVLVAEILTSESTETTLSEAVVAS